jgi:hypothetical protein
MECYMIISVFRIHFSITRSNPTSAANLHTQDPFHLNFHPAFPLVN